MSVRILEGDALTVLRTLPDQSVQCCVTSPPYNTLGAKRIPENPTGMHKANGWLTKVRTHGYSDDLSEEDYRSWQAEVFWEVRRVLVAGGSLFYNHKIRYRDKTAIHPLDIVRSFEGFSLRQEIIWDRGGAFAFNARMFAPSDERLYWMVRDDADHKWNQQAAAFLTVWRIGSSDKVPWHPCPYPPEIVRRCILATTDLGDTVLDPFSGAGTTGLVSDRMGRHYIGIELDSSHASKSRERILDDSPLFGDVA